MRTLPLLHIATAAFLVFGACVTAKKPGEAPTPTSMTYTINIPYADTDNPRQALDLLIPKETGKEPLPVIVYIHGGAWNHGEKKWPLYRMVDYVASGEYAAVMVGYRLSGEAQWPAQIHDCKAAIRWVRANAKRLGLDADRIGVMGDSAGGHLVAMLGTSGDVSDMDGELGLHTDVSSRVSCVVDYYGPTDFLHLYRTAPEGAGTDQDVAYPTVASLLGAPIREVPEKAASASPITYVTAGDPPFLILHGTADPVVPFNQSELLHAALKDASATSTLITVEGGGHGWDPGIGTDELSLGFFDHHLRGKTRKWEEHSLQARQPR